MFSTSPASQPSSAVWSLLHGYLTADTYQRLMATTAFIVNASHGEGQCLPLMEYLSIGKPAIAPCHSAMADYIDDAVGFVVQLAGRHRLAS